MTYLCWIMIYLCIFGWIMIDHVFLCKKAQIQVDRNSLLFEKWWLMIYLELISVEINLFAPNSGDYDLPLAKNNNLNIKFQMFATWFGKVLKEQRRIHLRDERETTNKESFLKGVNETKKQSQECFWGNGCYLHVLFYVVRGPPF